MDWIFFGDDWGVHPSTAQHLVLNMPPGDRVVWVDSIGMRQPTLNISDLRRIWSKARMMLQTREQGAGSSLYRGTLTEVARVKPKIIPWHLSKAVARFNSRSLAHSIGRAMRSLGIVDPVLVSSTPVVAQYLQAIPHSSVFYLRQDEYECYPGCDPELVQKTEPTMFDMAEAIFVTARSLYPAGDLARKTHYLPHGVQFQHFSQVHLQPSRKKVLGFFGTIDERMDFRLVKEVAEAAPDWQLEFIGDAPYKPSWFDSVPNIHCKPVVPFSELPGYLSDWTAAWIPYVLNDVTAGINPLKVREYLAAGLASHCVPLSEAFSLSAQVMITDQSHVILHWMNETLVTDNAQARLARRESVRCHDWTERSRGFREIVRDALGAEKGQ